MDEISNITAVNKSVVEKLYYLPFTDRLARELIPDEEDRVEKMKEIIDKVTPLQQKMSFDTTNRMGSTLRVLRACRVLNYQFELH